jgi:hypothetical protein
LRIASIAFSARFKWLPGILTVLQNRLNFRWPAFARRYHPNSAVIGVADKRVRARVVVNPNEFQIDIRFPVQRDIEVAKEYPPRCPVVEFNNVAF